MGKKGRRLPLLCAADFGRVVKADGWYEVHGTKHLAFEHPTKFGKVNIDAKWDRVKPGNWICRSVCEQAQLTRAQFEHLYWKTR